MGRARLLKSFLAGLVVLAGVVPAASAAGGCSQTPAYDPAVTSPSSAIAGWPDRRATTQELIDYVKQVDGESGRVRSGTFAHSWNGTPLVYAIVSSTPHMTNLQRVVRNQKQLRDPRVTSLPEAQDIAAGSPAIVWYTANVHGNEPSGGDAALQILYELAARTDCAAQSLRDRLVVGIIPTQNPDGRDAVSRTNSYGFDMNRDWFARTQPETDGKLTLLSKYPPVLYVDAHEMASSDFFFPPNADPIYHEISPQSVHWINGIYGPALRKAFEANKQQDPANWDYFNYDVYDLFYMGYGDTVPTTAFTSAGMTFEKGAADTDRQRELEQFVAGWTAIQAASDHKTDILNGYYRAHADAVSQGRRGRLQPNRIYAPGHKVERQIPDMRVRNYFLFPDRAYPEVAHLVDRLLRMGVDVYQLKRKLEVPDLRMYGRHARKGVVPKGAFWIPLDQPQKHWIQSLLGEDTYVPFPYFYDVTAWSNPLLMNLHAGFSGGSVKPDAVRISRPPHGRVLIPSQREEFIAGLYWFAGDAGNAVAGALALVRKQVTVRRLSHAVRANGTTIPQGAFVLGVGGENSGRVSNMAHRYGLTVHALGAHVPRGIPVREPKIAVFSAAAGGESYDHLRYVLDKVWRVPWTPVTGPEVAADGLATGGYDVFVVPGVITADLEPGREQIRDWISAGGTYVGTARPGGDGGTAFAVGSGFTSSTTTTASGLEVPGTMFRVRLSHTSPVTLGAPRFAYWYHLGEDVLAKSTTGANAGVFPKAKPDFWYSGYAKGSKALHGSAALVDEKLGTGHVVLFSGEPNYRAYTEGTAFLLANALVYPKTVSAASAVDVSSRSAAPAVRTAMESAHDGFGPGRPIVVEVPLREARAARAVLRTLGAWDIRTSAVGRSAILLIPNPANLDVEAHPYAYRIIPALRSAGITVRYAAL